MIQIPFIDPGQAMVEAADPAVLIRYAFEGVELGPLIQARVGALGSGGDDAARLIELSLLFQLVGERDKALLCLDNALDACRVYHHAAQGAPKLRLLVLATRGDLMANTPVELMIEGRGVDVAKIYLDLDHPWPLAMPDHDLALMAVSESDETHALLEYMSGLEAKWPRPMINTPAGVLDLARDRLYRRLEDASGIAIPPTLQLTRADLAQAVDTRTPPAALARGLPLIIRPVGSHAGKALERVDDWASLQAYLAGSQDSLFYVSPFIDYASADGLYRKYRIACFGGRAHLCHMAVSEHWMVHYLNAGMAESAAKRAEEQRAMETFDEDFARRHADAFTELQARLGLSLFAVDCAETPDGELLIFEADVAMIIHDLDPADLYPYKKVQMRKVFDAFERFLHAAAGDRVSQGGRPSVNQFSAA